MLGSFLLLLANTSQRSSDLKSALSRVLGPMPKQARRLLGGFGFIPSRSTQARRDKDTKSNYHLKLAEKSLPMARAIIDEIGIGWLMLLWDDDYTSVARLA